MRYSEEPYPTLARVWRPRPKSTRRRKRPQRSGANGAHPATLRRYEDVIPPRQILRRGRPIPPHSGAVRVPPRHASALRRRHPARRIEFISLIAPSSSQPLAQKQKIGPDCNFFAISNCSKLSNRESRHKNAGNWPCCGLLPPSGDEKRAPNRKKVAKMPRFLFLRRAKPPQRAELP